MRQPLQLYEQHTLLCLLSLAYSVCVPSSMLFQHVPSRSIPSYLCSVVYKVLCARSLREHDGAVHITPKLHSENTMVTYQLSLRFTLRSYIAVTAEKYMCISFSNFLQYDHCYSTNTNVFMVQRMSTYIP